MQERQVQYLEISRIERDDELQMRAELDREVVREYANAFKMGAVFPPVLVFTSCGKLWLADGYHRTSARELLGQTTVLAEIRPGSREDAIWASVAANQAHGLRRSNADKRRSVERALVHPRAQRLSNRQIASHCGVHHHTVGRIREELERSQAIDVILEREVTRGGSTFGQRVGGIGDSNRARPSANAKPLHAAVFAEGCEDGLDGAVAARSAVTLLRDAAVEAPKTRRGELRPDAKLGDDFVAGAIARDRESAPSAAWCSGQTTLELISTACTSLTQVQRDIVERSASEPELHALIEQIDVLLREFERFQHRVFEAMRN